MLGMTIGRLRRKVGMTQEQLAQQLDVTNQAVSKWETDQCCPDVALLPKLADILGVTMDELFGREVPKVKQSGLPWDNDDALHIVVYAGHTLIGAAAKENQDFTIHYEGPAKDILCNCNLSCGDVSGNVKAGGHAECGDVGGDVSACGEVSCGDVGGDVNAGGEVSCGDVEGSVKADSYVECGDVGGSLSAGSYVECGDVGGNLASASYVECGDVGGHVSAASYVECGDVKGNVSGNGF